MATKGERFIVRIDWGFGTEVHGVMDIEWWTKEDFLYSTKNSYPISCGNLYRKRIWKRTDAWYTYDWMPLLYSRNDHTTLQISYTAPRLFKKLGGGEQEKCAPLHCRDQASNPKEQVGSAGSFSRLWGVICAPFPASGGCHILGLETLDSNLYLQLPLVLPVCPLRLISLFLRRCRTWPLAPPIQYNPMSTHYTCRDPLSK